MADRQKPIVTRPIVTELALADETDLVKLTFAGTPDVGFPLQQEVRDIPAEIVRRVWNEGLRDYESV